MSRPRARILAVMWGKKYIDFFASVSGPALLAGGNLPELVKNCSCEFIFLTEKSDIPYLKRQKFAEEIERYCPIRCIEIDDIITPGLMGYTLTHAYARGILDAGADMTNIHFVFLNADFVLADGTLGTLANWIVAGHDVVMAPSLRANMEVSFPFLCERVDPDTGVLAISPREAVAQTLDNLHPTAIANIVNQPFSHSTVANQFFWRFDAHILIAHYYLLFMFCIRPTRQIKAVHGFCDYTFVPEMCPDSPIEIIRDSDDGFILEMQSKTQELKTLALGKPDHDEITRQLSEWTTKEHRYYAMQPIIFHAKDVPDESSRMIAEASDYMRRINDGLDPEPRRSRDHPYWLATMEARGRFERWSKDFEWRDGEISDPSLSGRGITYIFRLMFDFIAGVPPNSTLFHFDWIDHNGLAAPLKKLFDGSKERVLYVASGYNALDRFMARNRNRCVRVPLRRLLSKDLADGSNTEGQFDACFCYMHGHQLEYFEKAINQIKTKIKKGSPLLFMIHESDHDIYSESFSRKILLVFNGIFGRDFSIRSVFFSGSEAKKRARLAINREADRFLSARGSFPILTIMKLGLLFVRMFFINVTHAIKGRLAAPSHATSSVVIEASFIEPPARNAKAERLDTADPVTMA